MTGWDFVIAKWDAIAVGFLGPVLVAIFGYWRLRRLGVNESNIAILEDSAKMRSELMGENAKLRQELREQGDYFERELEKCRDRETALTATNNIQALQIATLKGDVRALEADVVRLTNERNHFQARLR